MKLELKNLDEKRTKLADMLAKGKPDFISAEEWDRLNKQAILNGSYGVNRRGNKVKYLFTSNLNDDSKVYLFIEYSQRNCGEVVCRDTLWTYDDFTFYNGKEHPADIIGLWQDKPESFDLEMALAGEPVITRDNCKAYVQAMIEQPEELMYYTLIGYGFNGIHKEFLHWDKNGLSLKDDISCNDIVGMWKDPELVANTITVTLHRPLSKPKEGMWFIQDSGVRKSSYTNNSASYSQEMLRDGFYFATKEDAQAWLDALKNNRQADPTGHSVEN